MALIALGVISRKWVTERKWVGHKGKQAPMWEAAASGFFDGTEIEDLERMLTPYRNRVATFATHAINKNLLDFALRSINDRQLVILGVHNWRKGLNHWVLAVGVESTEVGGRLVPQRLLLLDPSADADPAMPWNAVVSLQPMAGRRARRLKRLAEPSIPVTLKDALSIGSAQRSAGK